MRACSSNLDLSSPADKTAVSAAQSNSCTPPKELLTFLTKQCDELEEEVERYKERCLVLEDKVQALVLDQDQYQEESWLPREEEDTAK